MRWRGFERLIDEERCESLSCWTGSSGDGTRNEAAKVVEIHGVLVVDIGRGEHVSLESLDHQRRSRLIYQLTIFVELILSHDELVERCDRFLRRHDRTRSSSRKENGKSFLIGKVVLMFSDELDVVGEDLLDRSFLELIGIGVSFGMGSGWIFRFAESSVSNIMILESTTISQELTLRMQRVRTNSSTK